LRPSTDRETGSEAYKTLLTDRPSPSCNLRSRPGVSHRYVTNAAESLPRALHRQAATGTAGSCHRAKPTPSGATARGVPRPVLSHGSPSSGTGWRDAVPGSSRRQRGTDLRARRGRPASSLLPSHRAAGAGPIISQLGGVGPALARPPCAPPSNHPHGRPSEIPLACAIMDLAHASECLDRASREDTRELAPVAACWCLPAVSPGRKRPRRTATHCSRCRFRRPACWR